MSSISKLLALPSPPDRVLTADPALVHLALLVYHYVTTFDAECTHFWGKRRKFGLGWSLFLANRYLPLVAYMIEAPWWAFNRDPAVSRGYLFLLFKRTLC